MGNTKTDKKALKIFAKSLADSIRLTGPGTRITIKSTAKTQAFFNEVNTIQKLSLALLEFEVLPGSFSVKESTEERIVLVNKTPRQGKINFS